MPFIGQFHYLHNIKDPTEIPVIFLHGAGGNALSWPANMRNGNGRHDIFLEIPGHGRSTGVSAHSIEGMAKLVLEFVKLIRLNRAAIVGHSMGGAIASWIAINEPDRVHGLALLSTAPSFKVNPAFLLAPIEDSNRDLILHKLVDLSFGEHISARTKELAYQRLREVRPSVLHNDFMACADIDMVPDLEKINTPTLILGGRDDHMVHPSNWQLMHEKIKGSKFVDLANTGHHIMFERPKEVDQLLREFLSTLSKTKPRSNVVQ